MRATPSRLKSVDIAIRMRKAHLFHAQTSFVKAGALGSNVGSGSYTRDANCRSIDGGYMTSQVLLEARLQRRGSHDATLRDVPAAAPSWRVSPSIARVSAVEAGLSYLKHTNERPYNYMYEPPAGTPRENCEYEQHLMSINDARSMSPQPSVHREGFELWDAPSAVTDFLDEAAIVSVYYKEMIELACAVTGARRAYVFDHQVRQRESGRPALTFGRHGDGSRPAAAGRIHNDYSQVSGRTRMANVLNDPGAVAAAGRFSIVNIWRSIKGPILDTPLAVCDARTVRAVDLVPGEVRYPKRTGELYLVEHSPRHRWSYFSAMDRHEALVFKQYDSQVDGVARFTPHSAFDLPDTPPDAPLRESIEIRCLVLY